MPGPVDRALSHVRKLAPGRPGIVDCPVTLNFHPDLRVGDVTVMRRLAREGVYRSQFETGVSNGGLSAFPGGERWEWESRMFGGAYDGAAAALRPKYGALNHRRDPVGGARRFGSCHLRLHRHVLARTTFCYPDSHLRPRDFGIEAAGALVALAQANRDGLDPTLDNYVEAHVHGVLSLREDAEAVVLDACYRDTAVEADARELGCRVEWHGGFRLTLDRRGECRRLRGDAAAEAVARIAVGSAVTPAVLGAARGSVLDRRTAKAVWHCLARYGMDP